MTRTLIVGGTGFLGSEIARAALAAGHEVSVLSRHPADIPGVTSLAADRFGPLDVLAARPFDLVFDTCAYVPQAVTWLLDHLAAPPDSYVMVSSISVHKDFSQPDLSETAPVSTATEDDHAPYAAVPFADWGKVAFRPESYGPLKRACELAAIERLGPSAILLRAGLIVGAGDRSDRLTWWSRRIDQGGQIPVPVDRSIQFIDVRDLAAFALHAATTGGSGIYNVTSEPFTFNDLLQDMRAVADSDAIFIPLPDEAFLDAEVGPWINLPLWLPEGPDHEFFFAILTDKARAAGLNTRPLRETLEPLLAWDRGRRDKELQCGLTAAQEALLLNKP